VAALEDADVAGDVNRVKPFGNRQAPYRYGENRRNVCHKDAVASLGRWWEDVG
jgi:hypothetical protein